MSQFDPKAPDSHIAAVYGCFGLSYQPSAAKLCASECQVRARCVRKLVKEVPKAATMAGVDLEDPAFGLGHVQAIANQMLVPGQSAEYLVRMARGRASGLPVVQFDGSAKLDENGFLVAGADWHGQEHTFEGENKTAATKDAIVDMSKGVNNMTGEILAEEMQAKVPEVKSDALPGIEAPEPEPENEPEPEFDGEDADFDALTAEDLSSFLTGEGEDPAVVDTTLVEPPDPEPKPKPKPAATKQKAATKKKAPVQKKAATKKSAAPSRGLTAFQRDLERPEVRAMKPGDSISREYPRNSGKIHTITLRDDHWDLDGSPVSSLYAAAGMIAGSNTFTAARFWKLGSKAKPQVANKLEAAAEKAASEDVATKKKAATKKKRVVKKRPVKKKADSKKRTP